MRTLLIPVLVGMLALGTAGAVSAAPLAASARPAAQSVDLGSLLAPDGTFTGGEASGTVNLNGWHLTSDMANGEAPRFAPGNQAAPDALEAAAWSALGSNGAGDGAIANDGVSALAVMGTNLFVGGGFINAAGIPTADGIAMWNGTSWSALGSNGAGNGALNNNVYGLAVQGTSLFAAGNFTNAAGIATADYVAKWSNSAWSALGSNGSGDGALNSYARAVVASASDVFVGGTFTDAANIAEADFVARFSSGNWFALGAANTASKGAIPVGSVVWALAYKSTASGYYLYIGGFFSNAAGLEAADYIVRWDGTSYAALGAAGNGNGALNQIVLALAVSGNDVYAGGSFVNAGSAAADYVARFDGSWHALGSNGAGEGAMNGNVHSIAVRNGTVFVGGEFQNAAGLVNADYVAAFDGTNWSALGANSVNSNGALNNKVNTLALGSNSLFAGGSFINIDPSNLADYVAAWGPLTTNSYQPDGRIKKGSAGILAGNDIYNTDGTNQTRGATKANGTSVTFYISIQNDGTAADSFKVAGAGSTTMYSVRYYKGTTEITSAVVAGTYHTASLAVGGTTQIKAVVKVKSTATAGSSVARLVTLTSTTDAAKHDTVKFTVKRS